MSDIVIEIDNLWKEYRLGIINHHTLSCDLQSWWARLRGKDDPNSQIDSELSPVTSHQSQNEDSFWALENISFEVRQGDILGIIGRNGAGKSTLLKILSKVTAPTKGEVRYKGRIASLLEVGTGFHPELTGRENIFLNGAILGMSKEDIRRNIEEIIAFAEIDKFIDTPVKRYSSGMYVRLAFAVAAHLEPEILIVDEVLAVGDALFQKKCLGKMKEVGKEGRTVLFVSHNMSAIRNLCSRSILLDKGNAVFAGSVPQAIDRYLSDVQDKYFYDIDLKALPRTGHFGSKLRLHRLRFNSGLGIWHGKPLEVELDFECLTDVSEVSFGVGFSNRDGVRLLTIDSDVSGKKLSFLKGQRGSARFNIPEFLLSPDTYSMDVGSRSGDNYGLEYFPQFGFTFVMPSECTPSAIVLRESISGGYRPIPEWHFNVYE